MKDSEFFDLLNLYLDHELSAADAARLEAEVSSNPVRRRIYREYCQMQKACKVLAQDLQTEGANADDLKKIVAFESGPRSHRVAFFATGAVAAIAACLAVVFITRPHEEARASVAPKSDFVATPALGSESAVVPASAQLIADRTMPSTVKTANSREDAKPKLVNALSLVGNSERAPDPLLTSAEQMAKLDWMRNVQIAPVERVSIEQFRFDARAGAQPTPRTYSNRQPAPSGMEWIAIRYQK